MKKTKKGYGKKALSVSLSMALMLGGTAPVQAADLFSDQTAEESTSMELYPEETLQKKVIPQILRQMKLRMGQKIFQQDRKIRRMNFRQEMKTALRLLWQKYSLLPM